MNDQVYGGGGGGGSGTAATFYVRPGDQVRFKGDTKLYIVDECNSVLRPTRVRVKGDTTWYDVSEISEIMVAVRTPATAPDEALVTGLLRFIGEDPDREGLRETPARVLKAWKEWAIGYGKDPADVLKSFEDGAEGCDEMVIVHNIPFISKCEHHLADVVGVAHVGYIPDGRIVGLSKLPRLVEIFARRLQVQERATVQIAEALNTHLKPKGVGVLIRASHACMSTRGVKIHGSVTTTSAMRGALLDKGAARKEFMDLCMMAERDR